MSVVKVVVYDVSNGWSSLLDYFTLNATHGHSSFTGARSSYITTYVTPTRAWPELQKRGVKARDGPRWAVVDRDVLYYSHWEGAVPSQKMIFVCENGAIWCTLACDFKFTDLC